MDVHLPKLSGIEVLRELRSDKRLRSVPIVMFSGSSMDSEIRACYDHGAQAFVLKPVDFKEYTEKLAMVALFWLRAAEPRPLEAA
jgi:two-component system, response regulator